LEKAHTGRSEGGEWYEEVHADGCSRRSASPRNERIRSVVRDVNSEGRKGGLG